MLLAPGKVAVEAAVPVVLEETHHLVQVQRHMVVLDFKLLLLDQLHLRVLVD